MRGENDEIKELDSGKRSAELVKKSLLLDYQQMNIIRKTTFT